MTTLLYVIGLFGVGIIVWLIASSRFSKQAVELEGKCKSSEAVNNELRQQILDLSKVRDELTNEKQIKASLEAQYQEAEKNLKAMEEWVLDKMGTISLDALTKNSKVFLELAQKTLESKTTEGKQELENKKELIDKSIETIEKTLTDVRNKLENVEKGSIKISSLVEHHADITSKLKDTTEHLKHALASSKKRGEWGERMAEDILKLAGLVEGINYIKQKTLEGSSGRPDYTFYLPNNLKINMDVKFPMENYQHYLDAHSEHDRRRYKDELLKNTRIMIRQVTTRDYINPTDNTVDYVVVFIPNEQVYNFIHEADPMIMDEALKQKVILCSPFTLYAVLAVIRQSVENFNLERTATEILKLLGEFSKQWGLYKEKFESMGKRLDDAKKEYDLLTTTRSNMLERPLKKIEELRKQDAIECNETVKIDGS